uniref:Ig-like domain-containing protein n=1 Tax=Sphaeramia orbicularis TaxID=375764 RepID=A0A672ZSF4_9TELE
ILHSVSYTLLCFLPVLLIPATCKLITVCIEDDNDLRVDCLIKARPNKIASYEFSWSSGTVESVINTNVSGSSPEARFRDKSTVEELEDGGYRMTLTGFTDTLPHNTTYMCKVTGASDDITVEKDKLIACSAVTFLIKSSFSWFISLLVFFFYQTHH